MLNTEFVQEMMLKSKAGGLKQAFVIEAVYRYSKNVLGSKPWGEEQMISFEAWRQCAEECVSSIDNRNEKEGV